MGKIKLLDKYTINKIAAGEVVERPSSVVKELVENSIDAGSTAITVEIKDGGKKYIRVTDNGSGIDKDDVEIAFKRHATSKIEKDEDLLEVKSLGFRGEALASIAAVSMLEMITKTREDFIGAKVNINGGEMSGLTEVGAPDGTTITIQNLFYNTPARLEFLKAVSTEGAAIGTIMEKLSMAHPEISFKFINNGKVNLYTEGTNDLKTVIYNVYGKDVASKLIPVDYNDGRYEIKGYIAKPEISKANRKYENLFINGRFINSYIVNKAVEDALKTRIMVNKFPVFCLHLNISSKDVDVNVHPTKMEVRFSGETNIYDLFYSVIKDLITEEVLIPKAKLPVDDNITLKAKSEENKTLEKTFAPEAFEVKNNFETKKDSFVLEKREDAPRQKSVNLFEKPKPSVQQVVKEIVSDYEESKVQADFKVIGQVLGTYWIVEHDDKVFFVDQHAAHEKVLYEKIMNQYENDAVRSQMLVVPIVVDLSIDDENILKENIKELCELGYQIEDFGDRSYILRSVPIMAGMPSDSDFFMEILADLGDKTSGANLERKIAKVAVTACRAAIKANDKISTYESERMIKDLFKLDNPYTCPHGRPIIVSMDEKDLEKMFKRIV
ncbi:MAG: DNA mismatch repair endonuclease MutL [Clostridia bacterium]|jgi:DNA mismatch repair protein MutL|nr:DNA mismatch repair endonuclease MutL [Clostridia bacterium]